MQEKTEIERYPLVYLIPWSVLDRDQVEDFDKINMNAEKNDINVGWSSPCIEIWFFSYFGIMPLYAESVTCCDKFKDKFKTITGMYMKNPMLRFMLG